MALMITLRDGEKPSPKGERLSVYQKDNGQWELGFPPRENKPNPKAKDKAKDNEKPQSNKND